mgnify:CR=1 FL=1
MTIAIDAIRECFEGAVPAMVATSAPDGTPNVSYVSQVHYVDRDHVALSFQFFSKTRENVLANPRAAVLVIHPPTAAQYRLSLRYLRTETEGPLFEYMKARLAAIACGPARVTAAGVAARSLAPATTAPALPAGLPLAGVGHRHLGEHRRLRA